MYELHRQIFFRHIILGQKSLTFLTKYKAQSHMSYPSSPRVLPPKFTARSLCIWGLRIFIITDLINSAPLKPFLCWAICHSPTQSMQSRRQPIVSAFPPPNLFVSALTYAFKRPLPSPKGIPATKLPQTPFQQQRFTEVETGSCVASEIHPIHLTGLSIFLF